MNEANIRATIDAINDMPEGLEYRQSARYTIERTGGKCELCIAGVAAMLADGRLNLEACGAEADALRVDESDTGEYYGLVRRIEGIIGKAGRFLGVEPDAENVLFHPAPIGTERLSEQAGDIRAKPVSRALAVRALEAVIDRDSAAVGDDWNPWDEALAGDES